MDAAGPLVTPVTVVLQATSRRPASKEQDLQPTGRKLPLAVIKLISRAINLHITLSRLEIYPRFLKRNGAFIPSRSRQRSSLAPILSKNDTSSIIRQLYVNFLGVVAAGVVSKLYNSLNYDIIRSRYLIQHARKLDERARHKAENASIYRVSPTPRDWSN